MRAPRQGALGSSAGGTQRGHRANRADQVGFLSFCLNASVQDGEKLLCSSEQPVLLLSSSSQRELFSPHLFEESDLETLMTAQI